MATIAITPDHDMLEAEIFVAAPPERVFQALTDPAQMPRWWGQEGMYRITECKADLRSGGKWSSVGVGADGAAFRVDGEYLEIDPPRLLVHTWVPSYSQTLNTVVRWELEPRRVHGLQPRGPHKMGTGTNLKLRHTGFAGDAKAAADHGNGWKRVLAWMQAFVEEGATADTRPAFVPPVQT
jgi:uncharacterized protein YndB with AHSA1/START domain